MLGVRPMTRRAVFFLALSTTIACTGWLGLPARADLVRANLHIHTKYSNEWPLENDGDHAGAIPPYDTVMTLAAKGLGCVGLSDHGGKIGTEVLWEPISEWPYIRIFPGGNEWSLLASESARGATGAAAAGHPVIPIRGFEWTLNGGLDSDHVNIFGTSTFCDTGRWGWGNPPLPFVGTLDGAGGLYQWVLNHASPSVVCQFNHPWYGTHLNDLALPSTAYRAVMPYFSLIEIAGGPAEVGAGGYEFYHRPAEGEIYYKQALENGWHVGATIGDDNWGTNDVDDSARIRHTGVWVDTFTGAGVLAALRERRVFASEAKNLSLDYDVASGYAMGSTDVPRQSTIPAYLVLEDPDGLKVQAVTRISNGGRETGVSLTSGSGGPSTAHWEGLVSPVFDPDSEPPVAVVNTNGGCGASPQVVTFDASDSYAANSREQYFFFRIIRSDGLRAYSAPVWIERGAGRIIRYQWSFGDGTSYSEEEGNAPDGACDGQTDHVYTFAVSGFKPVTLTVTDDRGRSTSNQHNVYLGGGPTYIGGTLSADTRLTRCGSPYIITGSLLIEQAATLTVDPGVEVRVLPYTNGGETVNAGLQVGREFGEGPGGRIVARGTPTEPIVFTSGQPQRAPGDWSGIFLFGSDMPSDFRYCVIEYAGAGWSAWIDLWSGAGIRSHIAAGAVIDHCTIRYSSADGICVNAGAPQILDATVSDNAGTGVMLCAYNGVAVGWLVDGCMIARNGTGLQAHDRAGTLRNTQIVQNLGPGAMFSSQNATVLTPAPVLVSGNHFDGNGDWAMAWQGIWQRGGTCPHLEGNSYGSSQKDAMALNGSIGVDTVLYHDTAPYVILGQLYVEGGATLAIDPGVVIRVLAEPEGAAEAVSVGLRTGVRFNGSGGGRIMARGTTESPVVFTSAQSEPQPGDWSGIFLFYSYADAPPSEFHHCVIEYAGADWWDWIDIWPGAGILSFDATAPIIDHCIIRHSSKAGVRVTAGRAQVTGSVISDNLTGLEADAPGSIVAGGCFIHGNTSYGALASSVSSNMSAEGTDWGDSSGPYDPSDDRTTGGLYNPNGKRDRVSDGVDYDPWVGKSSQPPFLSSAYVTPATGDAGNRFTWRVKYWDLSNVPAMSVSVGIWSAATKTPSWRRMTDLDPSDSNCLDGKWYTYSCYLPVGTYSFRFAARVGVNGQWIYWPQPTGTYNSGPTVAQGNPVTLTAGYVTPTSGTSTTNFTWRVKYWNMANAMPDSVQVAIWFPTLRRSYWYRMWSYDPSDTNCKDGKWYTYSRRWLPAGAYAYRFAARQGSWWSYWPSPAGSYSSGPTVGP